VIHISLDRRPLFVMWSFVVVWWFEGFVFLFALFFCSGGLGVRLELLCAWCTFFP